MLLKIFSYILLSGILIDACPEGSVPTLTNPDMCYTWTDSSDDDPSATYDDAEIACNQKGGHLASILNQDENTYLSSLINNQMPNGYYWIGVYDLERDGHWKWTDGSPFYYSNWGRSEPDGDCGLFSQYDGIWYTGDCEGQRYYICLIPANFNTASRIREDVAALFFVTFFVFFIIRDEFY